VVLPAEVFRELDIHRFRCAPRDKQPNDPHIRKGLFEDRRGRPVVRPGCPWLRPSIKASLGAILEAAVQIDALTLKGGTAI